MLTKVTPNNYHALTLGDLPSFDFSINYEMTVSAVVHEFERFPQLPGVILKQGKNFVGMISRRKCYEHLGKPFGVEVFLKRSLVNFYHQIGFTPLTLSSSMRIDEAVQLALNRDRDQIYEPLIITFDDDTKVRLLDMHSLLLAQTQLLLSVNRLNEKQVHMGRSLAKTLEVAELLNLILDHLMDVIPYNRGVILLMRNGSIERFATRGYQKRYQLSDIYNDIQNNSLFNQVYTECQPILYENTTIQVNFPLLRGEQPAISWIAVPLTHSNEVLGVISLVRTYDLDKEIIPQQSSDPKETALALIRDRKSYQRFTKMDLDTLQYYATTVTTSIRNAQLHTEILNRSLHDDLTQIYNRRGFFEKAQAQFKQIRSVNQPASILMLDLDYFKKINDRFGHAIGDQVISSVAQTCKRVLRDDDLLGRYGGEEFIVLLTHSDLITSRQVAERLRRAIESMVIHTTAGIISLSASIGIALLTEEHKTFEDFLRSADQALYMAKQFGRNRVIIWDSRHPNGSQSNISQHIIRAQTLIPQQNGTVLPYDDFIETWVQALELRDHETLGHAHRVTKITMELAKMAGIDEAQIEILRRGAMLHDIGKIAIPDRILLKQGSLTIDEWEIMYKHPIYAYELLNPISELREALEIPYCHHEKWDGTGYPNQLKGEQIPLSARLFAVADVWDALNSDRCYRSAWKREDILLYIQEQANKTFDPLVVQYFLQLMESKMDLIAFLLPAREQEDAQEYRK